MEQLIIVNEQDEEMGSMEKLDAHRLGVCHRAFSVFIFRKKAETELELLLQKRHPAKYHCGGLWTNTCCGHPRPGEAALPAATRRLQEEMGLVIPLVFIQSFHYIAHFKNGLIENEVDHVFVGMYQDEPILPAPLEVADFQWVPIKILLDELAQKPHDYTPWFAQALTIALKNNPHPNPLP